MSCNHNVTVVINHAKDTVRVSKALKVSKPKKVRSTKLVKGQFTRMGRVVSVSRVKFTPSYDKAGRPKNVAVRFQNKGLHFYTAMEFVELYAA